MPLLTQIVTILTLILIPGFLGNIWVIAAILGKIEGAAGKPGRDFGKKL